MHGTFDPINNFTPVESVPGSLLVVRVLSEEDDEVADKLHKVAGDRRDHHDLVHHRSTLRLHLGKVHAVVVVPELLGVEEDLKLVLLDHISLQRILTLVLRLTQ